MSDFNVCVGNFSADLSPIFNSTSKNASKNSNTFKTENSQRIFTGYLLILCGVVVVTWYLQMVWRMRRLYWHYFKTPGPFNLPFIGIAYKFLSPDLSVLLQRFIDIQAAYPEVAASWFGPRLYFIITKPEYVEKVLSSQYALNKDHLYRFVNCVIGEGVLTVRASNWKKHRKAVMPAFNQKVLDTFQDIFFKKADLFANHLQSMVGQKNLALFELLSKCTLDIICETAFGLNMNIQSTKGIEFAKALDNIMEITSIRTFHMWHQLTWTWKLYPISREFYKNVKKFNAFVSAVIENKQKYYSNRVLRKNSSLGNAKPLDVQGEPLDGFAFMDILLENNNFTDQELLDEIKTFLAAGTDTTATTLCCVFTMLALHQDVQQKVYEEFLDILGPDRRPFPNDLGHMKYTDRVIKETLRLFPVAPLLLRSLHGDIEGGDMVFPKGSSVIVGSVFIQRNPAYWPDPLKFDPDRFLPENSAKIKPGTYIPFSYGPRNCIGGKYAMMSMKTIMATILRRYKFFTEYKSVEEIKLTTNLVIRLKDGPKMWIETR